jgi:hypothetical protein
MWAMLAPSQSKAGLPAVAIHLHCIPIVHTWQGACAWICDQYMAWRLWDYLIVTASNATQARAFEAHCGPRTLVSRKRRSRASQSFFQVRQPRG